MKETRLCFLWLASLHIIYYFMIRSHYTITTKLMHTIKKSKAFINWVVCVFHLYIYERFDVKFSHEAKVLSVICSLFIHHHQLCRFIHSQFSHMSSFWTLPEVMAKCLIFTWSVLYSRFLWLITFILVTTNSVA